MVVASSLHGLVLHPMPQLPNPVKTLKLTDETRTSMLSLCYTAFWLLVALPGAAIRHSHNQLGHNIRYLQLARAMLHQGA